MASGTIGDKVTGANNVTGVTADYADVTDWEDDISGSSNTGTIIIISSPFQTSAVDIDNTGTNIVLTAHVDAALNAPTYSALNGRARSTGAIQFTVDANAEKFAMDGVNFRFRASGSLNCLGSVDKSGGFCFTIDPIGAATIDIANFVITHTSGTEGFFFGTFFTGTCNVYHSSQLLDTSSLGFERSGAGSTVNAYAHVVMNGLDGLEYYNLSGGEYNVSSDATAPGSSSNEYARNEDPADWFEDTGSTTEDLALASTRQGWWTANKTDIDQTGWPSETNTDFVGTTRVGADIDPGCWQTPSAPGGVFNPYYFHEFIGRSS